MQDQQAKQRGSEVEQLKLEPTQLANKTSFKLSDFDHFFQELHNFFRQIQSISEFSAPNIIFRYCQKYQNWDLGANIIEKLYRRKIENIVKWQRLKKNWGKQDLRILVWIVNKYAALHHLSNIQSFKSSNWNEIARLLPHISGKSCMFKVLSFRKAKINKYPWTESESSCLIKLVEIFGTNNWKTVAEKMYEDNLIPGKVFRNAKQCKQHWICYLNPVIRKGPWSKEQDSVLLREVIRHEGTKRWTQISKILIGRTQNSVKNRFNLLIQKEQKNHSRVFDQITLSRLALQNLSIESKSMLQNSVPASLHQIIKKQEIFANQRPNFSEQISQKSHEINQGLVNDNPNKSQPFTDNPEFQLQYSNTSYCPINSGIQNMGDLNKHLNEIEGKFIPYFCVFYWPSNL